MNRTQFTDFLKSPDKLSQESAVQLAEVLEAFPYCQTAQLLYVKSLYNQKSMLYNNQLKIAAAYATDRTVLHRLINDNSEAEAPIKKPDARIRSISDEQIVTELSLPASLQGKKPFPEKEILNTSSPIYKKQPSSQEIADAGLKEPVIKAGTSELKGESDEKEEQQRLRLQAAAKEAVEKELQMRAAEAEKLRAEAASGEALEKARQFEAAEAEKIRLIAAEKEAKEKEKALESKAEEIAKMQAYPPAQKQVIIQNKKTEPVPEPEPKSEPLDTDDILKTITDLDTLSDSYIDTAIDARMKLEVEKEDPAIPNEHWNNPQENEETELSFTDWLRKTGNPDRIHLPHENNPELEEKKNKESELIERFIKEEPKISKPKKEFYSPVSMARQSVVEDPEFVTETLASIYASQGNNAKAIMAYHTLSLKYPEKKLYFASLIEKLEQGNT